MDGKWDIAGSGHVDKDEHAKAAAVRECKEELGITVSEDELTFFHLSHRISERTYYDIYFRVNAYSGTPAIMEPDKAADLKWFPLDGLPEDMIPCRRMAVNAYLDNVTYSEIREEL